MEEKVKKLRAPRKPKTSENGVLKAAPVKKAVKGKLMQMQASHEQIAALAHRLWQESGQQHGHDAEHWLRAEQMLLGKAS